MLTGFRCAVVASSMLRAPYDPLDAVFQEVRAARRAAVSQRRSQRPRQLDDVRSGRPALSRFLTGTLAGGAAGATVPERRLGKEHRHRPAGNESDLADRRVKAAAHVFAENQRADELEALLSSAALGTSPSDGAWVQCLATLAHVIDSRAPMDDVTLAVAIETIGTRCRRFRDAKHIFFQLHKSLRIPRTPRSHAAIMGAAAACGAWGFALTHLELLRRRRGGSAADAPVTPSSSIVTAPMLASAIQACVVHHRRQQLAATLIREGNESQGSNAVPLPRDPTAPAVPLLTPSSEGGGAATDGGVGSHQHPPSRPDVSPPPPPPWHAALALYAAMRRPVVVMPTDGPSDTAVVADPAVPAAPETIDAIARLVRCVGRWELAAKLVTRCDDVVVPRTAPWGRVSLLSDAALINCLETVLASHKHAVAVSMGQRAVAVGVALPEGTAKRLLLSCETHASRSMRWRTAGGPSWLLACQLFCGMRNGSVPLLPAAYESALRTCALSGKWDVAALAANVILQDAVPLRQPLMEMVACAMAEHVSPSVKSAEALLAASRFGSPGTTPDYGITRVSEALLTCALRLEDDYGWSRTRNYMRKFQTPLTETTRELFLRRAASQGRHGRVVEEFLLIKARCDDQQAAALRLNCGLITTDPDGVTRQLPDSVLVMVLRSAQELANTGRDRQPAAATSNQPSGMPPPSVPPVSRDVAHAVATYVTNLLASRHSDSSGASPATRPPPSPDGGVLPQGMAVTPPPPDAPITRGSFVADDQKEYSPPSSSHRIGVPP